MYQPDTEDLIPRCAPKPSISNVNEAIVRPSVPEVSIVFSQPESAQSSSTPPPVTTTYASWKKQCLPQIVYSPTTEIPHNEYTPTSARSNVYPMRSAATVVPTVNAASAQFSLPRSEPTGSIKRSLSAPHASPESPIMAHCNPTYTVAVPCCKMNHKSDHPKMSLDHIGHLPGPSSMDTNVLTICAGTQTDPMQKKEDTELNIEHLATKADFAQIRTMIVGMRSEQRRLMEIVQQLLVIQEKTKNEDALHHLRDVSTQCDTQPLVGPLPQKRPHIRYDSIEEEDSSEEEDDSYHLQKKTNAYVQSPPKIQQKAFHTNLQQQHSNDVHVLPKPITEQSMVMNELALKYLPNEKLSELLQDLHVSPVVAKAQKVYEAPLKNIENYNKSPIDLSTASYKYLKKYRLLPEENNNSSPPGNVRKSPNQQENMIDLDSIRRQPKFI